MKRLMLLPEGDPPRGWDARRDAESLIETLAAAGSEELEAVAIRGTPEECGRMLEAVDAAVNRQFHLFSGMIRLRSVHFHDPDHERATACMTRAVEPPRSQMTPMADTHVPIGDDGTWRRDDCRIVLPATRIPDTVLRAIEGGAVSSLVLSPMLPENLVVAGYEDHPSDLIIITGRKP